MVDEIRADYDQLGQVASRFTNQSQAIESMLREVRGRMEKLEDGGWIGRGASAFFSEMHSTVIPAVSRLIDALAQGAHTTNEISRQVRQAEEEAGAVFRH